MAITFSSDAQNLSFKDLRDTAELAESYFGTQKDPEQMPTTEAESRWLFAHIPECVNVIKDDGKLIGFAFIIPCREAIMRDFLSKRIAEAQLYARVKKEGINANLLQVHIVWPFPTDPVTKILKNAKTVINVEMNYTAQLASLIRRETGIKINHNIVKYNGRPISETEIIDAVREVIQKRTERVVLTAGM